MTIKFVGLLLVFLLVSTSQAQTVDDIAMSRFDLEPSITSRQARASYKSMTREIKRMMQFRGVLNNSLPSCERAVPNTECYYHRQYRLSNITRDWNACRTGVPRLAWVPPQEAREGIHALNTWKRRAAKGELFDCKEPHCKVIVHAKTSDPLKTVLAECNITKVGESYGSPSECMVVALITKKRTWVRVLYGITQIGCLEGPPIVNLLVVYPKQLGIAPIHSALVRALTEPPLSFSVNSSENTIVGTASYRVSPVLSPYREMVTARVDTRLEDPSNPAYLAVRISIDLFVNRYNTSSPRDWHQPDRQQEDAYKTALKNKLKSSMETVCQNFFWRGSSVLLCQVPENTAVPKLMLFYLEQP